MRMRPETILAFIGLSFPLNAFALCFEDPRPCSWYAIHHGQPTFIGTAVSEERVPDVLELPGNDIDVTVQKVTFNVEEPFDGAPKKTEIVYGVGTTNDFDFKVGERYLVYGWRQKDGRIRTAKCTRTAPVSEAAEDIRFLRSLPTQRGGEVLGQVRFVSPGVPIGTAAGTIAESGSDGEHKSRVSSSGSYELSGLAPGDYRETFIPDDEGTEYVTLKVSIRVTGSCVDSGVRLGNVPVSGRVIDDAGKPVSWTDVFLFYAFDGHYHPDVFLKTRTDASGKFSFPRVEAAKFILAAQPANSAMTFFPGTRESSETDVIEIRDGAPLSGLIVRISSGTRY
jgi:hypothetical protein